MCNRYPSRAEELAYYRASFGIDQPPLATSVTNSFRGTLAPFGRGVFIRPRREDGQLAEVAGQWG